MTQKTIEASYKQPVNYKLIKDGYKTINGVLNVQDSTPKTVDLPVPSEIYTTDLQYTVDTEVNGAPILNFSSFTLPDDETCEAKQYCYAPNGNSYNYTVKQNVKYYDNFTTIGDPIISNGIVSGFSMANRLQLLGMPTYQAGTITSFEFMFKIHTPDSFTPNGRLLNDFNSYDDIKLEVTSSSIAFNYGESSTYIANASMSISTNTDYWIKVVYNEGTMSITYSIDGINYSLAVSEQISSSNIKILSSDFDIGTRYYGNQDTNCTWAGSIDLSETYIKINGSYYWLPYREVMEDIDIQIPGILDYSVFDEDDNWQQSQNYNLYQLRCNAEPFNQLMMAENQLTTSAFKYKQYINQITIPARDYKWYYNWVPDTIYENFTNLGATIENEVITNFIDGPVQLPSFHSVLPSNNHILMLNIETGNQINNCSLFDVFPIENTDIPFAPFFSIYNSKINYNIHNDTATMISGETALLPNTKYWIGITIDSLTKTMDLYLLIDNNYNIQTLPALSQWTKELSCVTITYNILYNAYMMLGRDYVNNNVIPFGGKVYLGNSFSKSSRFVRVTWKPYYQLGDTYLWMTNKSIYNYIENLDKANLLDFSKSYLNVAKNQYSKYINPIVYLMPIDGGESHTTYKANGRLTESVEFNKDTGILSNCTATDYLSILKPFLPENNTWEINLKVKTPNSLDAMHYLLGSLNSYYWTVGGELSANNTFGFGITSTGESWDIGWLSGITTVTANTWYWIKLSFTGTAYKFELSTDGETYTLENSVESSTPIYQNPINSVLHLGTQATGYTYWIGEIDLLESNIKINNQIWWQGTTEIIDTHKYLNEYTTTKVLYQDLNTLPSTLLDNNNFIMLDNKLVNGPASYNIDTGRSYGYFVYTPAESGTVKIKAYISSEGNYDVGGCYIGTQLYNADRIQIRDKVSDGNGTWIFSISGSTSETEYAANLVAGTTYYVQFYYAKDGSGHDGSDRVYITSLEGFKEEIEHSDYIPGCLYNYIDDGQAQQFDVYYDTNYTQPILVESGEIYSSGTKVDTITIPSHDIWDYQSGGIWIPEGSE